MNPMKFLHSIGVFVRKKKQRRQSKNNQDYGVLGLGDATD